MKKETLDQFHEATHTLDVVSDNLERSIRDCLLVVGFDKLAGTLSNLGKKIRIASEQISQVISETINTEAREQHQASLLMVGAALAAAMMERSKRLKEER